MSELLAVAFDEPTAADDVLHQLRSQQATHLVELEDACVAQHDQSGQVHLKQAIGHLLPDALSGRFWHGLVHHILHHGGQDGADDCGTPDCSLDRRFCCDLADALRPGSSALFVLARRVPAETLVDSLRQHHGRILRSSLPEAEEEQLEVAVGMRPPRAPSADELRAMITREEESEAIEGRRKREAAEAHRRQEIERLRTAGLSPDGIRAILQRCSEAAQAGQARGVAYRFPSDVCLDGGRAINNSEPDWPASLAGQPRAVYDYWQSVLRPKGYHLKAEILNYPGGVPGDVGFVLSWA